MLKKLVGGCALLVLVGCSTNIQLDKLSELKPNMQGTVSQPFDVFSACVYKGWGSFASINRFDLPDGLRLVIPSSYGPLGVIDIAKRQKGTAYHYYQHGENFGSLQSKMRSGIQACL